MNFDLVFNEGHWIYICIICVGGTIAALIKISNKDYHSGRSFDKKLNVTPWTDPPLAVIFSTSLGSKAFRVLTDQKQESTAETSCWVGNPVHECSPIALWEARIQTPTMIQARSRYVSLEAVEWCRSDKLLFA